MQARILGGWAAEPSSMSRYLSFVGMDHIPIRMALDECLGVAPVVLVYGTRVLIKISEET